MFMDMPDDRGRGWRRLSQSELIHLIVIALALMPRGVRRDFGEKNTIKSDAAKRSIAGRIAEHLKRYPVFGPARPIQGHSIGQGSSDRSAATRPPSPEA